MGLSALREGRSLEEAPMLRELCSSDWVLSEGGTTLQKLAEEHTLLLGTFTCNGGGGVEEDHGFSSNWTQELE